MKRSDVPDFLQHLPFDEKRGYVVPFFVAEKNGEYNFTYQDYPKLLQSREKNLCSICGKKLDKREYWIVGGILTLTNRVCSDYPMHERCARYSLATCPHMLFQKLDRKGVSQSGLPVEDELLVGEKPTELYLIKADKIECIQKEGYPIIKFRPIKSERYHYTNNKLEKTVNVI